VERNGGECGAFGIFASLVRINRNQVDRISQAGHLARESVLAECRMILEILMVVGRTRDFECLLAARTFTVEPRAHWPTRLSLASTSISIRVAYSLISGRSNRRRLCEQGLHLGLPLAMTEITERLAIQPVGFIELQGGNER